MRSNGSEARRSPWVFMALVLALAVPFWLIGSLVGQSLLQGLGVSLPLSALAFVCPITAALILVFREEGLTGVARLLKRALDPRSVRPKVWYLPALLLLPLLYSLSYVVQRLIGLPLPVPDLSPLAVLLLFGVFLVTAVCEEVGWTGYALDPLQARWGALGASLMIGVVWAGMHVVPDLQGHQTLAWIAGQRSFSVALRVLLVWLYNSSGKSVFAPIVCHAMDNVSVFARFPDNGDSHYDPAVTAVLTALAAAIVTLRWGPKTLARWR